MSPVGERTEEVWRADVVRVLARLCRAHGLDGLRRVPTWKSLLSVIGAAPVEAAASLVNDAPTGDELDALRKEATRLLGERRQIRLAAAAEPRRPAPPSPPGAPDPEPPTVVFHPDPAAASPEPPAVVFYPDPAGASPEPPAVVFHPDPAGAPADSPGEEPLPEQAFITQLPLYSLQAVAASLPAGEWGRAAAGRVTERLGWVPVDLAGRKLTERMFVARIEGHSMDDGRTGIREGALAVFEFGAGDFDQEPTVLARGAFDDPETGSHAVKRIRQVPGADGAASQIVLISANPDKTRYPDIVVDERDAPSVNVLARFVAALGPDDHARTPRLNTPPRRRDVTSPEGIEKHRARLAKALTTFFGPPRPEPQDGGAAPPEPPLPWAAHLELPACDPGTLSAVCGPLAGLLSRVRTVVVRTGPRTLHIAASNVRTKVWREPVPPSCEPYLWAAEGFEEDLADEMAQLTIAPLDAAAATVFRLGAGGVGHRLAASAVTPGNTYRLLVPPALAEAPLEGAVARDGWRALDLEIPSPVPPAVMDQLRSIGVTVGADAYSAAWAVTCPRDHRRGRGEELYPCFAPQDTPCIEIHGPPVLLDGEVRVVVQGERESTSVALPAGERWLVELGELPAGHHVLEVLPVRTSIETTRLFFRVDERARPLPRADVDVKIAGVPASPETEEQDLAELGEETRPFEVTAPPLWPVAAHWQGGARLRGPQIAADEEGRVDARALLSRSAASRRDDPVGELTLDFGELGARALRHRRQLADVARLELPRLVAERLASLAEFQGQLDLLVSRWLAPVCKLLGYSLHPLPVLATFDLPAGFGAHVLMTVTRKGLSFERRPVRLLLVLPAHLPLTGAGANAVEHSSEALRLCKKLGYDEAIVTDGRAWAKVRAKQRIMSTPHDLEDALRRAALGGLDDFLDRFLAPEGP